MDDELKQIIENLDNKTLDQVLEKIEERNAPTTIRTEAIKLATRTEAIRLATRMTALHSINSMQETLRALLEIPRSAELHRAAADALADLIKVKNVLSKDIQNAFDDER